VRPLPGEGSSPVRPPLPGAAALIPVAGRAGLLADLGQLALQPPEKPPLNGEAFLDLGDRVTKRGRPPQEIVHGRLGALHLRLSRLEQREVGRRETVRLGPRKALALFPLGLENLAQDRPGGGKLRAAGGGFVLDEIESKTVLLDEIRAAVAVPESFHRRQAP
jgi:hypothetical protein